MNEIVALGRIVAEKATVNLVCIVTDAVSQSCGIDFTIEIGSFTIVLNEGVIANCSMDLLATRDILCICQTCDLCMFFLHGKDFIKTSLTILNTVLQLCEVSGHIIISAIRLVQALIFEAIALTRQNLTHASILVKCPICQFEFKCTDQVLRLKISNLLCHSRC